MEFVRSYDSISFGLPRNRGGSAPALVFSRPAQRLLTLRPARSPSRLATLCTRGFSSLVASTAALIATGWSEPVPGRAYSRCGPPPFTAHPVCDLRGVIRSTDGNGLQFKSLQVLSEPSGRSVLPQCTSGLRASLRRFRYSWAALSAALSLAIYFPSVILLWKEGRLLIAPALHGSGSFRGCSWLVLWSCSDSCRVGPNLSWRQEH